MVSDGWKWFRSVFIQGGEMGKAIVVGLTIIIIVMVVACVVVYFRRRQSKETALSRGWAVKGDLTARQEKQLIDEVNLAAKLFRSLLIPPANLAREMTYLSHEDRQQIETWLRQYTTGGPKMRRVSE